MIPARPRRSTVALGAAWVAAFVLWVAVRPDPEPLPADGRGVFVPATVIDTTVPDAGDEEPADDTVPVDTVPVDTTADGPTDTTGVDTTDTTGPTSEPSTPGTPSTAGPDGEARSSTTSGA